MKRITSILLLIIFCVYTFTFKTHYCYHADTNIRFHGDCEHEQKEAKAKGTLAHTNFFPKHYECVDIVKNALPDQTKFTTLKNAYADAFVFIPVLEIAIPQKEITGWLIPEFNCRSATIILPNATRGSPLV